MFYIVLGFQLEFRGLVLSHSCVPGACGNSQWTAGVQCIQWPGVWSQLCAALTCWVCLVVPTVVHLSAGENTEPQGGASLVPELVVEFVEADLGSRAVL